MTPSAKKTRRPAFFVRCVDLLRIDEAKHVEVFNTSTATKQFLAHCNGLADRYKQREYDVCGTVIVGPVGSAICESARIVEKPANHFGVCSEYAVGQCFRQNRMIGCFIERAKHLRCGFVHIRFFHLIESNHHFVERRGIPRKPLIGRVTPLRVRLSSHSLNCQPCTSDGENRSNKGLISVQPELRASCSRSAFDGRQDERLCAGLLQPSENVDCDAHDSGADDELPAMLSHASRLTGPGSVVERAAA